MFSLGGAILEKYFVVRVRNDNHTRQLTALLVHQLRHGLGVLRFRDLADCFPHRQGEVLNRQRCERSTAFRGRISSGDRRIPVTENHQPKNSRNCQADYKTVSIRLLRRITVWTGQYEGPECIRGTAS